MNSDKKRDTNMKLINKIIALFSNMSF